MSEILRKLTEAETAPEYEKFMSIEEKTPAEAVLKAFENPIEASQAILPENIMEVFDKPSDKADFGYCVIPCEGFKDGAYATFKTFIPNATGEMLEWWFAWRGMKSANYCISNPAHNHSIGMAAIDKDKFNRKELLIEVKSKGIIQSEIKDIGGGLEDFLTHLQRPEDMEVDPIVLTDKGFIGGYWIRENRKNADPYKKAIDMFADIYTEKDGGLEVDTYLWCGYRGLKGKNVRRDAYGPVIDEEYAKTLGLAMAQEMAHLASILPDLYNTFAE